MGSLDKIVGGGGGGDGDGIEHIRLNFSTYPIL